MEIKRDRNLKQLICASVSCIQSCISLSCEDICHTLSIIYKKNCAGTQICGPQTCVLCFFYLYNRFASELLKQTIQKRLRGIWQHQRNVSYCLFGSKKHLMTKLFQNRRMPFYQFGEMMYLDKISTADWVPFICSRFESQGKQISEELAQRICETVEGNSSYVQQLAWNVLAETEKVATEQDFNLGVDALLAQCTALFEEQTKGLTGFQLNFLRALCDGVTTDFSSKAILEGYNLGSKSNISRIKAALQDKEMIDFDKDSVYLEDPVFKIWCKRNIKSPVTIGD